MTDQEKESVALFRFKVISPLLNVFNLEKSINKTIEDLSLIDYKDDDGNIVHVSKTSIERWYYTYKKRGFDYLKPLGRSDAGNSRKIDEELGETIKYYLQNKPRLSGPSIYDMLINNGLITKTEISESTISRYVCKCKREKDLDTPKEFKRYQAAHINDIWCADTSYSFKIKVDGIKKRLYIIAIIDDASRYIVGINVFFEDNFVNFLSILKDAVSRYGVPVILNLDNGSPYRNKQMELLGARIGTTLHYDPIKSPTSKAKIERFFRTLKDQFMASYTVDTTTTIEKFRKDLNEYIFKYNNTIHSSIHMSPFNRYYEGKDQVRTLSEDMIRKSFLLELDRTVSRDNVIQLNNKEYEAPSKYSGRKIRIRFSPDVKIVYVVDPDGSLTEIQLLDKEKNAVTPRTRTRFNTDDITDGGD